MIPKYYYIVYNDNNEIIYIHGSKLMHHESVLIRVMDNFKEKMDGCGWSSFCPKREIDEKSIKSFLGKKVELRNNTAYEAQNS